MNIEFPETDRALIGWDSNGIAIEGDGRTKHKTGESENHDGTYEE